jgi:DNA-binding NarL/FixJ family response regulator
MAMPTDDNVKGIFESRFGDTLNAKAEKNKDVMSLAQQGLSSSDIADELSMSRDTVSMIINNYKRA